jgi:hypothetical protein
MPSKIRISATSCWSALARVLTVAAFTAFVAGCGGGRDEDSAPQALAPRADTEAVADTAHEALAPQAAALAGSSQAGRIGIRGGKSQREFFERGTGAVFTPQGYNYVHLAQLSRPDGGVQTYHSTFNVGHYDKAAADAALDEMQRMGYNTVRVFLSVCCTGGVSLSTGQLNPEYLANVADFTRRAKLRKVAVLITSDGWLPWGYVGQRPAQDIPFEMINAVYFSQIGVQGSARFWRDFVTGLRNAGAAVDNVLAYSISNEAFADTAYGPFTQGGVVTAANGKAYDMSSPEQRNALISEGISYFAKEVSRSIREAQPTALVTMGFVTPNAPHVFMPGDTRVVPKLFPALNASDLDFVDLHLYPAFRIGIEKQAENIGLAQSQALVIMGEFGSLRSDLRTPQDAASELYAWRGASCRYGFKGWLMWTWDVPAPSDAVWWTGKGDGAAIASQLSPKKTPVVCG